MAVADLFSIQWNIQNCSFFFTLMTSVSVSIFFNFSAHDFKYRSNHGLLLIFDIHIYSTLSCRLIKFHFGHHNLKNRVEPMLNEASVLTSYYLKNGLSEQTIPEKRHFSNMYSVILTVFSYAKKRSILKQRLNETFH